VVLSIEDPQQLAVATTHLAVGPDRTALTPVTPKTLSFPIRVTVTASKTGEQELWAEALGSDGVLGRGHVLATFATSGAPSATLTLGKPCAIDLDCDDALYCTGVETCDQGICTPGDAPCGASFTCVTATCIEQEGGLGTCSVSVDHTLCAEGEYCNPVNGCIPGQGCQTSEECQALDGYKCNGLELCVNLVCTGGTPPFVDDGNICTQDGCNETEGVFHAPKFGIDGTACGEDGGERKICIFAQGGCIASRCGDGFVDTQATPTEACDDGPLNSDAWTLARHCNSACSDYAPYCGDSAIDAGFENCDDGDPLDTKNGCNATCQRNDVCGDPFVQSLYEECDDQDNDNCNGCKNNCERGCICSAPNACTGARFCSDGDCLDCNTAAHCGPSCATCTDELPVCGGAVAGCQCTTDASVRGSCGPGTFCDDGSCTACDSPSHCGQECLSCGGNTPLCGGAESGCITGDCAGQPDFTLCKVITDPDRSYDICLDGACVSPGCGMESCNPPGPSFARGTIDADWQLPDTSQRFCRDSATITGTCAGVAGSGTCGATSFCGLDAQYGPDLLESIPGSRWLRSSDAEPVVNDSQSGLMWQSCVAGLRDNDCSGGIALGIGWEGALAYCDSLTWHGYCDWRLPDLHEVRTLLNWNTSAPFLNHEAFPGTPVGYHWTASARAGGFLAAWLVGISYATLIQGDRAMPQFFRCVRGAPVPFPSVRFERLYPGPASEPVVADHATLLDWQSCLAGQSGALCDAPATTTPLNLTNALAYCENLTWAGQNDWRLPSINEMASIIDTRRHSPAWATTLLSTTVASCRFLTSTLGVMSQGSAIFTDCDGGIGQGYFGDPYAVRCVRDTTP